METNWEFQGRLTGRAGTDVPADFTVGTPFRVVVGFDTNATLDRVINGTASGTRYNYTSPMRFLIYLGTTCDPCEVSAPDGSIFLRDDYANLVGDPPAAEAAVDGISLSVQDGPTSIGVVLRGPVLDIINGPSIPLNPDPRLADLAISVFQACEPFPGDATTPGCSALEISGDIDRVTRPTFGTGFLFTARDCRVAQTNTSDTLPYDCFNPGRFYVSGNRVQTWSFPQALTAGGGVGNGGFALSFTPSSGDIDAAWNDGGTYQADLSLPNAPLASLFGSIGFGGPAALPVVKGYAIPSDVSRSNSNLYAYQKYNYSGGATSLPLVLDLTYGISENSSDATVSPFLGQRPGGAEIGATLAVLDGSLTIEQLRAASIIPGFNSIRCGTEADLGWPAGSILGVASHSSQGAEQGSQHRTLPIVSCASTTNETVQLSAGQDFFVAVGLQTPARGKAPQPPSTTGAAANGWVDAANTMRVVFDAAAPATVVQALVANIEPGCSPNCDFPSLDIKPGDAANCINVNNTGNIPVALLGSASFNVGEVSLASLTFGKLSPSVLKSGKPQCSVSDVNADGVGDLVCQFRNQSSNWTAGQAIETMRGQSATGAFEASDKVCLKQ